MTKKGTPNKLSVARLHAVQMMPYMASALYSMVPIERKGLGTLGVTADARMLYDPDFCDQLEDEQLAAILIHESMHLTMQHHDRAKAKGSLNQPMIWNMAADCEINDDLLAGKIPLPSEGKYAGMFPSKFGLEDHKLAEYYYDKLFDKAEKQAQSQEGDGDGEGGDESGDDDGEGDQPKHSCGSCSGGEPLPGEEPKPGESKGRTPEEQKRMRRDVAQAVKDHANRQQGSVPAGMVRWADEILAPPKVDWRRRVAARTRKAIAQRTGLVDFSYRRPSRRQQLGGDVIYPSMTAPIPTVGILVDTSGSMSDKDLGDGLGQIRHILQTTQAHTYLAVCDAQLYDLKKVRSIKDVQANLVGGGGTDLRPAIEALDAVGCDLIIGISDCMASFTEVPPRATCLWLRTGGAHATPPYGDVIDID